MTAVCFIGLATHHLPSQKEGDNGALTPNAAILVTTGRFSGDVRVSYVVLTMPFGAPRREPPAFSTRIRLGGIVCCRGLRCV